MGGVETLGLFKLTSSGIFLMAFLGALSTTILIFSLFSTAGLGLLVASGCWAEIMFCLIFTISFSSPSSSELFSSASGNQSL